MGKKQKIFFYTIIAIFSTLTIFSLIYLPLYYNVFHKEHSGPMIEVHIVLLVGSIMGLFCSLFVFDRIKKAHIMVNTSIIEERQKSVAEYNLHKYCPTAEKLHINLSEIISKYGINRVRSGFLSYDLLYYIKPNIWFGFTYNSDYRDNWIDVHIGELYQFYDCIPRISVIGEYSERIKKLNAMSIINSKIPITENASKNIKDTVEIIKNTFEAVITNFDIEIVNKEKERLKSYLIKELKTFDDLKKIDSHAIIE